MIVMLWLFYMWDILIQNTWVNWTNTCECSLGQHLKQTTPLCDCMEKSKENEIPDDWMFLIYLL